MPPRRVLTFPQNKPDPAELLSVGGSVDRFAVSLLLYGEDLDPEEITRRLGVEPQTAGLAGSRMSPRAAPLTRGVWGLKREDSAPATPGAALAALLAPLPRDAALWADLSSRFEIRVSLGLFLEEWNRGFELPADLVRRIGELGASVGCDIYAPDDGEDDGGDRANV